MIWESYAQVTDIRHCYLTRWNTFTIFHWGTRVYQHLGMSMASACSLATASIHNILSLLLKFDPSRWMNHDEINISKFTYVIKHVLLISWSIWVSLYRLYDLTRLYIDAAFRGSTPAFRAAMAADLDSDLHLHWRAHDLPHHQYLDAVFAVFHGAKGNTNNAFRLSW